MTAHIPEPAKVVLVRPGGRRVAVTFDAGEVDPTTDDEREALARVQRLLERRADPVPSTVDDVKAWVGDDPARAVAALEVERARAGGPRTTLEPWLAGLADPDDDHVADADSHSQEGDPR